MCSQQQKQYFFGLIKRKTGCFEKWWKQKDRRNMMMIQEAKAANLEKVVELIDIEYNKSLAASTNFQDPETGFTAMHFAVLQNNI